MSIEQYFVPENHANICFDCQLALGGCSWSEIDAITGEIRYQPVPGWEAKKSLINIGQRRYPAYTASWHITACPLFLADRTF